MIEVKNLTKSYGAKKALDDISFSVAEGEVLGFLGPNGAGKSTTMNIITGYLSSDSGTVTVDGCEILSDPVGVKSKIGYLPEHPPLYLDMTVREYLSFMYDLKRLRLKKWAHIEEICELVKISDVMGRLIKNLSKGYRQRVGLAQALLGGPGVLILDEPTVGLDPKQIIEIRRLIQDLGESHTILLSSHILSEIQAVCSRVIVISDGRLVADDTSDNLSHKMDSGHSLTARVEGPEDGVHALLCGLPDILRVDKLGSKEDGAFDYRLEASQGADIRRELFRRLAERNWPLLALRGNEPTLEEIFLRLTDAPLPLVSLPDEGDAADGDAPSGQDAPSADESNSEADQNHPQEEGGDV